MSMADDMLNGMFCIDCGVIIGNSIGYPRKCKQCKPIKKRKNKHKNKKERAK